MMAVMVMTIMMAVVVIDMMMIVAARITYHDGRDGDDHNDGHSGDLRDGDNGRNLRFPRQIRGRRHHLGWIDKRGIESGS